MQFGKRVRELREQRGFTQKELADRLSVSVSYISKVENDRLHFGDYPSVKFIHKLSEELKADENELLLLSDRVPEHIRKQIQARPELFEALVGCDNETLDWVLTAIKRKSSGKNRSRKP